MTIQDIDRETVAELARPTVCVDGADFLRVIGNVLLHKGDPTMPILHAVHFEINPAGFGGSPDMDGRLLLVATDRYSIGTDHVAADVSNVEGERAEWLVDAADLTRLAKTLKTAKPRPRAYPVSFVRVSEDAIEARTFDGTTRLGLVEGAFVRWRSLWPTGSAETDRVAFAPTQLAKYVKADVGERNAPLRFSLTGKAGVVVVECGDTFRALQMPVRLSTS